MDTEKLSSGTCAIARSLAYVGDTWSALILRDAYTGMTQFDQFRTSLGIAPNILSRRLKALTEAGVLEKRRYSERPPRDEYVLTEAGRDFLPILAAMAEWGRRYNGEGNLSYLVDDETGRRVRAVVVDESTGKPLSSMPMHMEIADGSQPA
jgi:DNA-binding HxlR family transcriptional regulator